jgi:hypothetical protein
MSKNIISLIHITVLLAIAVISGAFLVIVNMTGIIISKNLFALILIVGLVAIVVAFGLFLAYAKNKGWKLGAVGSEIEKDIGIAENLATALMPFLPVPYAGIIGKLCEFVNAAVDQVKRLDNISMVPTDQRKTLATNLILADLKDTGITADDNVTKLIDLLIEDIYQIPKIASESNVAAIPAPAAVQA